MKTFAKNHNGSFGFPATYLQVFDTLLNESLGNNQNREAESTLKPRADVAESDTHFFIHVTLPGLEKTDIKVEMQESILKISGERKELTQEGVKSILQESRFGKFERTFKLPKSIDVQSIDAKFNNGILEISILKQIVEKKSTTIEIK